MADGSSRFTSDRRTREEASWSDQPDWEAGTIENVDVTAEGLVGRAPVQDAETSDTDIENWESGTLDNWSNVEQYFETKSSPVYEGAYSGGKSAGTSGPQFPPMYYVGSVRTPRQGDEWGYWSYFGGNSNGSDWVSFCGQSTAFEDRYVVRLAIDDSYIKISKYSNGVSEKSNSSNAPMSAGNWYKVIVTHGDPVISVAVEDSSGVELGSTSISDGEYTEGELGRRSHGDRYFDQMAYEGLA